MSRFIRWLYARSRTAINSLALSMLFVISAIDYLTPPQISTFVFYTIPIALAAWFAERASGVVTALLAAGAWTAKDIAFRGAPYSEPAILFWNTAARSMTFVLVAWLITEVQLHLRREQHLARTDPLTGLFNARAFLDELTMELARAGRAHYPVSLVYLDLDNFKLVNDQRGHAEGDRALSTVGGLLRRTVRRSDVLGRLGGDEFAMILPATDGVEARTVVSNVQDSLKTEMERHDWPITLSIGAITCRTPFPAPDALLQAADRLMYQVKVAGKNALMQRTWDADS
jgi:diguanylate cyclase (GGDEF)-like protein